MSGSSWTRILALVLVTSTVVSAQQLPAVPPPPAQQAASYVVGPQDVLIITFYDQPELTGTFTVETDGTFTYPLIGRVGGITLRDVEALLRKELVGRGFRDPQITVSVEQYRSQKVYVVGEVGTPGACPMSGDMRLVEALALAGSTMPTASGEAVIVHVSNEPLVLDPAQAVARAIRAPMTGVTSSGSICASSRTAI